MTSLVDRTISELRASHDELHTVVTGLSDARLSHPSAASDWTVAQVLSHLGSGAQIMLATLQSAVTGTALPEPTFNQEVWARWDALSARAQADGFLEHDEHLVAVLEALDGPARSTLEVTLGFLPAPVPVATFAGMRLNELAHHSWDVRAAFDPATGLGQDAAALLAEHLSGDIGFLLGFIGKADQLDAPARVALAGTPWGVVIEDGVALSATLENPTATWVGPLEAAMRLLSGRLTPPYTSPEIEVSGNVTLQDLRRVFPGF